jgi:hypothetical protein
MKRLFLILTLVLVSFAFLSADVYVKTKIHTGAIEMMGQKRPASDQIMEQWIGDRQFAQIMETQTMVLDLDKNLVYVIYPATKSYVQASLPLDLTKLLPPQAAQMMGMMKMTVTVTPSGESKKVGNWNCSGYDIDMDMAMMKIKTKAWATTDIPFDWKSFQENMMPIALKMGGQGMGMDESAIEQFKKIKGMQVATEVTMSMMGQDIKSSSEVVEISKKPAPAGIYSVPAGYAKQDKLTLQRGM